MTKIEPQVDFVGGLDQPTRRLVRPPRRFDQTQLKGSALGYMVHRDYAAHFFRWGWATRFVKAGYRVLDLGCGQEQPLAKVLILRLTYVPKLYVGVDLNRIIKKVGFSWAKVHDEFNFVDDSKKLKKLYPKPFDVLTCFEVIEHMGVADGRKMLRNAREFCKPKTGRMILSTPVFSGQAAANHVHEYTVKELQKEIERAGWQVLKRHGTFGHINKLRKCLSKEEIKVWDRMAEYYHNDVLSVIFAVHYPDDASNNVWVLKVKE